MNETKTPPKDLATKTPTPPADPAVAKMESMLTLYKPHMAALLGKHMSVEQVFRIALLALGRVPKLKECTTASFLGCVMESSRLRLQAGAGAGETWLIPFQNNKTGNVECTLIVDYRAIIKMMKRDAGIETVIAEKVCAQDKFKYGIDHRGPFLEWEPAKGDRGVIVGYVSASWNKGGKLTGVIYKTVEEIDASSRKKSMAANAGDGPWKTDPEWMYKKSVIRPLAKLNPGIENDDLIRAVALDERADLGLPQNLHLLADPTATAQIENDGKDVPMPKGAPQTYAEKIAWVKTQLAKKAVKSEAFDAWVAGLKIEDEEARIAAVMVIYNGIAAGTQDPAKVFALTGETTTAAPEIQVATFKVHGAATSEFFGEDAYAVRAEPDEKKYVTTLKEVFDAAKAAKKADAFLSVDWKPIEREGKTYLWIVGLTKPKEA